MSPAAPARIQSLFARAVELDPAERDALLAAECADDPALLAQLRELLAADDALGLATARKAFPGLSNMMSDAAQTSSLEGLRIGPYELRSEIGRGGMGAVYAAERVDGTVEQCVAVKLVRRELLDPDAFERFRRERRVLAGLDHPNIARLIDAAEAPDGTPYFVMELVDGQPIDAYCAAHGLDVRGRLRLMRKVCGAVGHAHRNLVVHRDLKPGNIVVTPAGEPKLLDFGIAKPLDEEHFATGTAQRFFSPYYAAPEQFLGLPIGVGCDVYALGLLLYELLSGVRPFAFEGLTAGQIERLICEVPPPPPSRRVPGNDMVRGQLDAELDDIVLKCLRKAPVERYASVEQLDADLANYLEGRPVVARGGHALYRARKFVGRHRLAFAISFAALAALSFAMLMILRQNVALGVERDRVAEERDNAQRLAEFLQDAFVAADPSRTAGADVTARQILSAAHERVESSSEEAFPLDFAATIAEVELSLAMVDEARRMAELAVERSRDSVVDERWGRLRLLAAKAQIDAGELESAAASVGETALVISPDDPERLLVEGTLAARKADYATAIAALERAAASVADAPPTDAIATAVRLELADALRIAQRPAESLESIEATIAWQLRSLPRDHPDVTHAMLRRVLSLRRAGRHDEALPAAREIHERVSRVYGDGLMAAAAENTLAMSLWYAGHQKEAVPHFEAAERMLSEGLGDTHSRTLRIRFNLAGIYVEDPSRFAEGERMYRACIAGATARLGPEHDETLTFRRGFADVLLTHGRADEALDVLTEHAPSLEAVQNPSLLKALRATLEKAYSAGSCKEGAAAHRAECATGKRMIDLATSRLDTTPQPATSSP